jgi:protein-tyrosine phosphatase
MSTKILFVCMGNICRSPSAQGVMEKLLAQQHLSHRFELDSAGTHAYHVGHPPDLRSQKHALRRGVDVSTQRARQVCHGDFSHYDFILAMDKSNLHNLQAICPKEHQHKLHLMLAFSAQHREQGRLEVQDPYYGGDAGFEQVLDDLEAACAGLLAHCQTRQPQDEAKP